MKVCITGLIGSGKSSVLNVLNKYGKNIHSTDQINNQLLQDTEYLAKLQQNFGNDIVVDGVLDKKALANIIFNDIDKRKMLNSLSHPKITAKLLEIMSTSKDDIFIEVPLLAESNLAPLFDRVWLVECNPAFRLERIMKRDNVTKELAVAKMNAQKDYQIKLRNLATDIIYNNGDMDYLEKQVAYLLQK